MLVLGGAVGRSGHPLLVDLLRVTRWCAATSSSSATSHDS